MNKDPTPEFDGLAKVGAATMAAGILAVSAAGFLGLAEDVRVNDEPIISAPAKIETMLPYAGIGTVLFGQQVLIYSYKRQRKPSKHE